MVARLQYLRFCLFVMYVNVFFVITCLYSAVNLTPVKEQRFIRISYSIFNVFFVIRCLYSAVSLTLVKEQRFIRIIYLLL